MSEIKVQCIDQAISFLNTPVISSGNVNYDTISFDFCSRWDGYAKTAIFYRNKDEVYYQLLTNDACIIPNEVLRDKGYVYIGVFGTQGDKTITSQVLSYRIQEGAVTEDLKPADPTPDIYAQIISKYNDYDERLAYFENRFNGSVGDAEKLGGKLPEYYASAESVTNIQTTGRTTLSTAGWYRVAEFNGDSYSIRGSSSNSCDISIKRNFSKTQNETYRILLDSVHNKQAFYVQSAKSNVQIITKIRYTYDATNLKAYIELYYNSSSADVVRIAITNPLPSSGNTAYWKAITPTATEETVDGVTVTTTYDIPANASPVTDLDLIRFEGAEVLTTSVLEKALSLNKNGIYNYKLAGSKYTGEDLPLTSYKYGYATILVDGVGNTIHANTKVILWGSNGSGCHSISTNVLKSNGEWIGWETYATSAELTTALANYVPVSGRRDLTGYLTTQEWLSVKNDKFDITFTGGGGGDNAGLYNSKLVNWILQVTKDGVNTFNGTATGNLPLTGGTINGNVTIGDTNSTNRLMRLITSLREAHLQINPNGELLLRDVTNGKNIIMSTKDGTNTFNGTASGNLPLNGGGTVSKEGYNVITLKNSLSNAYSMLAFSNAEGVLGSIGINATGSPLFRNSAGTDKYFIHTGNSARVVVSETPLTAEGAVRVW